MEYKKDDKVEHTNYGYGTFVKYENESKTGYYDECVVKFSEDAQHSKGKATCVKVGHLEKVKQGRVSI